MADDRPRNVLYASWNPGDLMQAFRADVVANWLSPGIGGDLPLRIEAGAHNGHPCVTASEPSDPYVNAFVLLSLTTSQSISVRELLASPGFSGQLIQGYPKDEPYDEPEMSDIVDRWAAMVDAFRNACIVAFCDGSALTYAPDGELFLDGIILHATSSAAVVDGVNSVAVNETLVLYQQNPVIDLVDDESEGARGLAYALGAKSAYGSSLGAIGVVLGGGSNSDIVEAIQEVSRMKIELQAGIGGDRFSIIGGARGNLIGGEE